jgi:uncharacterized membrane protein YbhN (UPF0104 family)
MSSTFPPAPDRSRRLRAFFARHLYSYLAGLVGLVVLLSITFARKEIATALRAFDHQLWAPVLGLTLVNYALRFLKWHRMLLDTGIRIPLLANARLYFACFTMVVTPLRLGELYKLVFLRTLHRVGPSRSLPVLLMERVTDAVAVLALAIVQPFSSWTRLIAVALALTLVLLAGAGLSHPAWRSRWQGLLPRLPLLGRRSSEIDRILLQSAVLLRPRSLGLALVLSTFAWFAECWGLYWILVGLGSAIPLGEATWIYALSTALGNLTFLPGGLGGTEASLLAFLHGAGIPQGSALAATLLVRAATLWLAVFLGLSVSFSQRRALQWDEVQREAARSQDEAPKA